MKHGMAITPRRNHGLSRNAYAAVGCRVHTALWLLARIPEADHQALADLLPEVGVVLWARRRRIRVSPEHLAARFSFSRAGAYRWLAALVKNGVIPDPARPPLEVVR